MIESLRKALADYEKELEFKDEGHQIKVTITGFLHGDSYNIVKDVMLEYGATYHKWNPQTKKKAYWTIPQRKEVAYIGSVPDTKPTKSLQTTVMLPKLPDNTRITVSYSRKVCPKQYESIGYSASVEVPLSFKDAANLIVTDCVEGQVAKRLKELEQS